MKTKEVEESRSGVSKVLLAIAALVVVLGVFAYVSHVRSQNDPTLTAAPPVPANAAGAPRVSDALLAQKRQAIQAMAARVFPMANTGLHKSAPAEGKTAQGTPNSAPAITASR